MTMIILVYFSIITEKGCWALGKEYRTNFIKHTSRCLRLLIVAPDEAMQPERRCMRGSPGEQLVPSAPGPVDLTAGGAGTTGGAGGRLCPGNLGRLAAGVCL